MKKIVTILLTLLSALTSFPQEIGNTVVRKDAEGKNLFSLQEISCREII